MSDSIPAAEPAARTTTHAARHDYEVDVVWTGNTGQGTNTYRSYGRTHEVRAAGKDAIDASADPVFLGEADRYNPEELLVASLSQCHMLWFLHLAAEGGVVITGYHDQARGVLTENADGTGQFEGVLLAPEVTVADRANLEVAEALHERAAGLCYIAKSVTFPVTCTPRTRIAN